MPYVIPTRGGYYVIHDDQRHTLAVAYTMQEPLHLKIAYMKEKYKADLIGLELVCEEDRDSGDIIKYRYLYYARPGTYRFVEESSDEAVRYRKLRQESAGA